MAIFSPFLLGLRWLNRPRLTARKIRQSTTSTIVLCGMCGMLRGGYCREMSCVSIPWYLSLPNPNPPINATYHVLIVDSELLRLRLRLVWHCFPNYLNPIRGVEYTGFARRLFLLPVEHVQHSSLRIPIHCGRRDSRYLHLHSGQEGN